MRRRPHTNGSSPFQLPYTVHVRISPQATADVRYRLPFFKTPEKPTAATGRISREFVARNAIENRTRPRARNADKWGRRRRGRRERTKRTRRVIPWESHPLSPFPSRVYVPIISKKIPACCAEPNAGYVPRWLFVFFPLLCPRLTEKKTRDRGKKEVFPVRPQSSSEKSSSTVYLPRTSK